MKKVNISILTCIAARCAHTKTYLAWMLKYFIATFILFLAFFAAQAQDAFITTWQANSQIIIPTTGAGYNYDVYEEDVNHAAVKGMLTRQKTKTGYLSLIKIATKQTYRILKAQRTNYLRMILPVHGLNLAAGKITLT
ncbi:MAG: hypothetical protein KF845_05395 [Cyclobacteriaceae bacterium]|nr:hypothetical protein [Cyclobacteriaceae bacterium]